MQRFILTVLILSGYTSAFADGVFESVVKVRQTRPTAYPLQEIPNETQGFIALKECDLIGEMVLACFGLECRQLLVSDCANKYDGTREWMRRTGVVAEVDWGTFIEFKESDPLKINIFKQIDQRYIPN